MLFAKTILLAVLSLGAMTFAAPIENTNLDVATTLDGCDSAYRGDHRACERGRDEKHDGRREERKGEREIEHGHIEQGLRDEHRGQREELRGQRQECRTGGRC